MPVYYLIFSGGLVCFNLECSTCLVGFLCTLVLCATLAIRITSFDGHAKGTEWLELAEQLISVDDGLDPNWSELLADANAADARSKVCSSINLHFGTFRCYPFPARQINKKRNFSSSIYFILCSLLSFAV